MTSIMDKNTKDTSVIGANVLVWASGAAASLKRALCLAESPLDGGFVCWSRAILRSLLLRGQPCVLKSTSIC